MTIELKKFGTTLLSRHTGKEASVAFQTSLKNISEQEDILANFEGVITFSPSWGHEFLKPLTQHYGTRFKLLRTDNPSVKATLEILEKSHGMHFNII